MNFASFLGNRALCDRLRAAQAQGRLSHGYLLSGPVGSGKHTLATILAAAMQCTGQGDVPCGRCPACRKVFAGTHPDVITCEDTAHKQFGVDAARSLCADAFIRPNEGAAKVYLLAQEANLAAQNTLLKLIEEPPPYCAFLLLTPSADRLLPTVRSRLQELHLAPLPDADLLAALRQYDPSRSEADCRAAMAVSGGYLGQAKAAMDGSGLQGRAAQFAESYGKKDALALTTLLISMEKLSRDEFCAELARWRALLHAALRAHAGLPAGDAARAIARSRTRQELSRAMDVLQKATDYATANVGVPHLCGALRGL